MAKSCPSCGSQLDLQAGAAENVYVCSGCGKRFRPKAPAATAPKPVAAQPVAQASSPKPQVKKVVSPPPVPAGQEEDPFAALVNQTAPPAQSAADDAAESPPEQPAIKLPPPYVPTKAPARGNKFLARFVSPSTRSILLLVFIGLTIVADVACMWSSNLQANLLAKVQQEQTYDEQELLANDDRAGKVAIANLAAIIIFSVFYYIWIYRIYNNLSPLKAAQIRFTPGWVIGWHFIPVVNIWKPCQAFVDIWQGSDKNTLGKFAANNAALVIIWWVIHLADGAFSYAQSRMMSSAIESQDIAGMISANNLDAVASVVSIMTSLLFVSIVIAIWKRQDARHLEVQSLDRQQIV